MPVKRTQKETKAILKAFQEDDVPAVKAYLNGGLDPNEIQTIKYGNIYDADNPYTFYDIALTGQVWYLDFIAETKNFKAQQNSLEVVKLLTPLVKSAYPLEDSCSYTWRALPRNLFQLDLGSCNQYKKPGMYDVLINAMLETGYDFAHDKDVLWTIGMFGMETAKKVLELTGPDDGASVFSAAENHNVELTEYLLKEGISPNKPFQFSDGNVTTALHEMIKFGESEVIKSLLNAGADVKVINGYGQDCLKWAKTHKAGQDIIDLLGKSY